MNATTSTLDEARRELASRKAGPYGLGRSWMLIDMLFQELDRRPVFNLDAIMDALSEAFAQMHPRTARDCAVEARLHEILSARTSEVEFTKSALEREEPVTNQNHSGRHSNL
jgi:hypothetical protein